MATIVNDRDVLLQATVPRYAVPTNAALILSTNTPVFQVAATGVGTPTFIDLTASLINLSGIVTYAATGGSIVTQIGNNATLAFADMVGLTTTVTVSITVDSILYTSSVVVTKVADGIVGNSARRAYTKTSSTSLGSSPATLATAGNTSFPPNDSWAVWYSLGRISTSPCSRRIFISIRWCLFARCWKHNMGFSVFKFFKSWFA